MHCSTGYEPGLCPSLDALYSCSGSIALALPYALAYKGLMVQWEMRTIAVAAASS